MGKLCQEAVPRGLNRLPSRRRREISNSLDVFEFNQDGKLNSATAKSPEDALHAAESYFQEVTKSSSRQLQSARYSPRTTLLDLFDGDTEEPAGLGTSQRKESTYLERLQGGNLEWPSAVQSSLISPGEGKVGLESPTEFSLDCSYTSSSPHPSMFSSPGERGRRISSAQADMDVETPSEFSPENGQDGGSVETRGESSPQDSLNSVQSAEESEDCEMQTKQPDQQGDLASKSTFEWNEVFRRSSAARSGDSHSSESFKTGRSGLSSTSSRASLSDEAISERAAAWGNGVASLVIKNSSRESTPRTSDLSSADFRHCGQRTSGVSKHVKDVLSSFQLAFVVCDVTDRENPILYASEGFFDMTGYSAEEVIGRSCRFLQGVDTDANEVSRIRIAVKKGEAYSGTVLNYKKNGTPFWNLLSLSPITDDKGVVIKYMGMQAEVSRAMAARRKKTALESGSKDVPRSICKSICEASALERPAREVGVPIVTRSSPKTLTATAFRNASSPGSKRYSLTYGIQGSKRYSLTPGSRGNQRHSIATPERPPSMKPWVAEKTIGGSERYTSPAGKKPPPGPKHRPSRTSSAARPFFWLLSAVRILEEEIGCDPNLMTERPEKVEKPEKRKVTVKKTSRINRMARGVLGFIRKLESKVWRRETPRARVPSNRVTAYDSESDMDFDDLPEVDTRRKSCYRDLRSESMPHISPTRVGSLTIAALQADLRARSGRYLSSGVPDTLGKKISASNTNKFVLDRQQFCIVHE